MHFLGNKDFSYNLPWIIPESQEHPFDKIIFLKNQGSRWKNISAYRNKKKSELEKAMNTAFTHFNNNGSKWFFFPNRFRAYIYVYQDLQDESVYTCQLIQEKTPVTLEVYEYIKSNFTQAPNISPEECKQLMDSLMLQIKKNGPKNFSLEAHGTSDPRYKKLKTYLKQISVKKSFQVTYDTHEERITDCKGLIEITDRKTNEHKVIELTESSERVFTPES